MSSYDQSKDKVINEKVILGGKIRVAIYSYNNGEPKMVIQELYEYIDKVDKKVVKNWKNFSGRLPIHEQEIIANTMLELMQ